MQFKNKVPCVKRGVELSKAPFSGGRLTATIANHGGLMAIDYYGVQRFGDTALYSGNALSAWTQLFRPCLSIGENLYYFEFTNTEFYPFGYNSHFSAQGVDVRHELYLLNDALVYRIEVLRNPKRHRLSAVMFQMNHTQVDKPERKWINKEKITRDNAWEATAIDRHAKPSICTSKFFPGYKAFDAMGSTTRIALTCDRRLHFEHQNDFKHNLRTARFEKEVTFSLVFGHKSLAAFRQRVKELKRTAPTETKRLVFDYHKSLSEPSVSMPNKAFESFLANTNSMVQSMRLPDIPGGARCANNGYWIWAWDMMVYSHAYLLAGQAEFAKQMLAFIPRYAHPTAGISHSTTLEMRPYLPMARNAQCLYGLLLYDFYLHTGDKSALRRHYAYSRKLVLAAAREEIKDTGLLRGLSIYPDNNSSLGETGDDVSAINNSIYYQALRAMEVLADELGKGTDAADWKARADRLQKNFSRFFDPKKGFFYTSLNASNFKPRKFYGGHAIFWASSFAQDLAQPHEKQIADFMKKHLLMRHGYRLMPKWDQGYMRDGNNNGYYDPYVDRFYLEMMKSARRTKQIQRFVNDVAWYWNSLTVPEAMTCEMENHGLTVDDPGKQQLFSMKVWWSIFFHTMAGIGIEKDGLSFTACDAGPIEIKGLRLRGRLIDFKITGTGWEVGRVLLDGKPIIAPFCIPFSKFKKHSRIEIRRSSTKAASK